MNLKQEWDSIDATEGSLDDRKWALAKALAESGKPHRELAAEVGRSLRTVQAWLAVGRVDRARGVTFAEAVDRARGRTAEGETKRKAEGHARKVLREADEALLGELAADLERDQLLALERAINKILKPKNIKKGEKQRKDLATWASNGAMAWFSVAEQLVNEGVPVPDGPDRETLKRSTQATRAFLDAVDRVLNEEITIEEFAAALDDRNALSEFLSA